MAILIPARDAPPCRIAPADGHAFTLPELQAIVGGYIEAITTDFRIQATGETLVVLCNEDGKRLNLPPNGFATSLLRTRIQPGDVIVGDVLLCSIDEAGGTV